MKETEKLTTPEEVIGSDMLCPIKYVLDIISGKWKLPILCMLASGRTIRYNSMRRRLNGITNVMLSKSLKELQDENMIHREQYNEIPPKVEYSLTEKGRSIIPTLLKLAKWGRINMSDDTNKAPLCEQCLGVNKSEIEKIMS